MGAAPERNDRAKAFQDEPAVETVGNSIELACLNAAIDQSGVPAKVLADELGVSEGEFSKLRSGRFRIEQLQRLRSEIRADWRRRLEEHHAAHGADREVIVLSRAAHALLDALVVLRRRRRTARAISG